MALSGTGGDLSDLAIQRTVGPRSFAAGVAYASAGRVRDLRHDRADRLIYGSVQGTRPAPYSVAVTPTGDRGWSGRCTCPVSFDCKHVAAVLLAAREARANDLSGAGPASAAPVSWEQPLTALVRSRSLARRAAGADQPRLALQVDPVGSGRLRLRPVLPGRLGGWVRGGVSWRDVQYSHTTHLYGTPPSGPVRAQRELLRAFLAAYQVQAHGQFYGYGEPAIHLDEIGPTVWSLLEQAREVGLELVPVKAVAGPIVVAPAVSLQLDLRADDPDAGVRSAASLRPVLRAGDRTVAEVFRVHLVGEPAHGISVADPETARVLAETAGDPVAVPPGLVLARLEPRPDEALDSLLRRRGALEIPAGELPRFLGRYYPPLRQSVTVVSSDGSVELPDVPAPELAVTVTFGPEHEVGLDWEFSYDGVGVDIAADDAVDDDDPLGDDRLDDDPLGDDPLDDPFGDVWRDLVAERRLLDELDPGTRRLLRPGTRLTGMDAVTFTRDRLPQLDDEERLAVTVVGERPDFRPAESPPVISLSTEARPGESDWFDLGVAVSVEGEDVPFDALFRALAEGRGHLVLASGRYLSLDQPALVRLRELIEEARRLQDRTSDGLRVSVFQAGLWEELCTLGVVETQSARWAEAVQGLLDLSTVEPPAVPAGFAAQLRPYQLDGFRWLAFLWQHHLGGVLADDMGLGKTVQALALICHAREAGPLPGPFLVVAPTSVVGNWAAEARRFAPGLKVCAVTETVARRGTPLAEDVAGADLVVTSYALFRIDAEAYQGLPWAALMLDEAQFVKNHQAKTYQCARRLSAPFKLAITGTPLENSLMDLWSLLSIVAPGLYPSPERFTEDYRRPIERGESPELLATLRRRIRPLMLRRTKDQVVADLPPKQEQVLDVVLNPKHQRIYQTHLQRERQKVLRLLDDVDKNRFEIFRSLTLLRQLSLAPELVDPAYVGVRASKIDAFVEQLTEVVDEGHRALVFSQFTGFLALVKSRLDAEGISYGYLDGRTRKRTEKIADWTAGDAPVFLISLKAGGVGLNLTAADYCFILDPWWNPAVEAQAVDRTHRIGQDRPVMVYRLVSAGTIEEKVMELKARKQELFSRVMDDGGALSAALSVEDIRGLLG
jgi:superfamily II DNA or RNA helicase